ncbi:hypothetical protein [Kouleothrix sp.]|uniref:hypothetical protein n=1 Tax=Kouleothrix sp. TaxID=2779161 RepID=UPI00391903EC
MSKRLTRRQELIFLLFVIGLLILAIVLLPRLLPAPTGSGTGAAGAPTGTTTPQLAAGATVPAQPTAAPLPTLDPATASRCRDQVKGFISQLDPVVSAWVDARKAAGRAPQEQLAGQVDKLLAVRQQAHALAVPSCAEAAYLSLLDSMDHTIEAYRGFVNELPDEAIQGELQKANQSFTRYVGEIDQLR